MKISLWVASWFTFTLGPVLTIAQTNYLPLQAFGTSSLGNGNCVARLLEGSDGALYGVAGSVFRLNKDGSGARTLHTFGSSPADGATAMAGLVELSDGCLYGTTTYGGTATGAGFGTVFKLNKDGTGYVILHRFGIEPNDGKYPGGGLTAVGQMLYGTTWDGGSNDLGTIFKLDGNGTGYATVHSFRGGGSDLATPRSDLVKGSDGALYGLTAYGSNSLAGAVFKITPDGTGYTVLRNFAETGGDANNPWGLLEASDGVLYGVSNAGGSAGYGALFKLGKDGSDYRVVHSFAHDGIDGIQPNPLFEGKDGALYGTTSGGGGYEGGTAFKINKDGAGYIILRNFRNGNEAGWYPAAGLVQAGDGIFYGTTYHSVGDGLGPGVVFALSLQPRSWFTSWALGENCVTSLTARAAADAPFRLQAATSLAPANWQDTETNYANALGVLSFTNLSNEQTWLYYRLVAH